MHGWKKREEKNSFNITYMAKWQYIHLHMSTYQTYEDIAQCMCNICIYM